MDNNNKEVTPREFKVGDVVWDSIRHGKGVIDSSDGSDEYVYPVKVEFDNGSSERYTLDGRHRDDNLLPSLYHQPYKIELLEVPEELPEVGTPVYVWDDRDEECYIQLFVKKDKEGAYITSTSQPSTEDSIAVWTYMSLTLPDKFK